MDEQSEEQSQIGEQMQTQPSGVASEGGTTAAPPLQHQQQPGSQMKMMEFSDRAFSVMNVPRGPPPLARPFVPMNMGNSHQQLIAVGPPGPGGPPQQRGPPPMGMGGVGGPRPPFQQGFGPPPGFRPPPGMGGGGPPMGMPHFGAGGPGGMPPQQQQPQHGANGPQLQAQRQQQPMGQAERIKKVYC